MLKAVSLSAAVWVQSELYTCCLDDAQVAEVTDCLDDAQVAGIVLSCALTMSS